MSSLLLFNFLSFFSSRVPMYVQYLSLWSISHSRDLTTTHHKRKQASEKNKRANVIQRFNINNDSSIEAKSHTICVSMKVEQRRWIVLSIVLRFIFTMALISGSKYVAYAWCGTILVYRVNGISSQNAYQSIGALFSATFSFRFAGNCFAKR